MKIFIYFLAIFVLLVIQAGILLPLHIAPVNLLLVLSVSVLLVSDFNTALAITLACGVMLDFLSGTADGLISLTLVSTFLILQFFLNFLVNREPNRLVLFSYVAGGTVLYFLLFLVFNRIFSVFHLNQTLDMRNYFAHELPLGLIFNIIFTYPVFLYFSYVQSIQSRKPRPV